MTVRKITIFRSNEKYSYSKLWHEMITQLQYKDYCIDIFAIDTCYEKET